MRRLDNLLYEQESGVGIITLNRPHRLNALSTDLLDELYKLLDELEKRDEVRCVIITGAPRPDGRPCFSAGADIKEMVEKGTGSQRLVELGKTFEEIILASIQDGAEGTDSLGPLPQVRVYRFSKPLIAAIDGICTAGGLELAMCCDLRVVAETAEISDLHMKTLGRLGGAGVQTRLPQVVGLAKAKEIIWTGIPMDGNEAHRIGLANQVFPPDKLMEGARSLAKKLASMDPFGMRISKLVLNASLSQKTYESLRYSDLLYFLAGYMDPKKFVRGAEAFAKKK